MSNGSTDLEYVGFWARVGASIVDTILIVIIVAPILNAIYGTDYWLDERFIKGPADFLLNWVLPAVAIVLFWIARQATPGKMLIGAKIVDAATGGKPTTRQLIVRYLGYYVSTIPLLLGLIWVAFDPRKQGWHDKLAGTVVVRSKHRGTEPVQFTAGSTDRRPGAGQS
jgi:uncharacterized RDD family membrane protein YckC